LKLRVAVIYGGRSGEHEVSIRSANAIMAGMDPSRYEIVRYFISKEGKWDPRPILPEPGSNAGIDVVFPALHGTFGEDGTMQGLLELAGLPYVGPGVLGSSASMDKDMMKRIFRDRGLPIVEYVLAGAMPAFDFPMFVKPANLGSSVGISKVNNAGELAAAVKDAQQYDTKVIIERGITGREFECSVLGNESPEASVPCEIIPSREFYDYEDKYLLDKAVTKIPADLTPHQTAEMRRLAVEAFRAIECEGMSRVDFLLERATGLIYINEINTIPGFTSISMYPKMWEYSGVSFGSLIDRLIALAMDRHRIRQSKKYSR
jgi:D-alanine-D-alanine ligase